MGLQPLLSSIRALSFALQALILFSISNQSLGQVALPPPAPVFNSFPFPLPTLQPPPMPSGVSVVINQVERIAPALNLLANINDAREVIGGFNKFAQLHVDYRGLTTYRERSNSILAQLSALTDLAQAIQKTCPSVGVGACVSAVQPVNATAILLQQQLGRMGPALTAEVAANFSVNLGQTVAISPPLDFNTPGLAGLVVSGGLVGIAGLLRTDGYLGAGILPTGTVVPSATVQLLKTAVAEGTKATVDAANLWIGPGSALRGDGTVTGTVANLGGTIGPGNSPGTLTVEGNLTFLGGTLEIELGGTRAGNFDLLNVAGSASFSDGTFLFSLVDGFTPSAGDRFTFLTADDGIFFDPVALSMQFANPFGLDFRIIPNSNSLILEFFQGGTGSPTPVPEPISAPGTLSLLLAGVWWLYRDSRRHAGANSIGASVSTAWRKMGGIRLPTKWTTCG